MSITSKPNGTPSGKSKCLVSRQEFHDHARSLDVVMDTITSEQVGGFTLEPREFSTRSLGWYMSGKGFITVNGQQVGVQIGVTVTMIGSKELS